MLRVYLIYRDCVVLELTVNLLSRCLLVGLKTGLHRTEMLFKSCEINVITNDCVQVFQEIKPKYRVYSVLLKKFIGISPLNYSLSTFVEVYVVLAGLFPY